MPFYELEIGGRICRHGHNQFWVLTIDSGGQVTGAELRNGYLWAFNGAVCNLQAAALAGSEVLWLTTTTFLNDVRGTSFSNTILMGGAWTEYASWKSDSVSGLMLAASASGRACVEVYTSITKSTTLHFLAPGGGVSASRWTPMLAGLAMASDGSVVASPNQTNLVVKYSADGQPLWAIPEGTAGVVRGKVAVDAAGNIFVLASQLVSLTPQGSLRWIVDPNMTASALGAGPDGRVYVAGASTSAITVRCIDATGEVRWSMGAEAGAGTTVEHLSVDGSGRVFMSGILGGSARFGSTFLSRTNAKAMFIAVLQEKLVPPSIRVHPIGATLTVGSDHMFSAQASGSTPLTYQWMHDGVMLAGATGSTFTLTNAQLADAGKYWVVVRNSAGSVSSAAATLNIQYAFHCGAGAGGQVSMDPSGPFFPPGATVTITAIPDESSVFDRWSDGSRENPRLIQLSGNLTLAAVFKQAIPAGALSVFISDQPVVASMATHFGPAWVRIDSNLADARIFFCVDGSKPVPGVAGTQAYRAPFLLRKFSPRRAASRLTDQLAMPMSLGIVTAVGRAGLPIKALCRSTMRSRSMSLEGWLSG